MIAYLRAGPSMEILPWDKTWYGWRVGSVQSLFTHLKPCVCVLSLTLHSTERERERERESGGEMVA
jgi:hypothetical protein